MSTYAVVAWAVAESVPESPLTFVTVYADIGAVAAPLICTV
jgi:hypothetical protein